MTRPDLDAIQKRCDADERRGHFLVGACSSDVPALIAYVRELEAENLALRERVAGHHAIVNETAKAAAIDAGAREEETWRERVAELEAVVRQRDERVAELEAAVRQRDERIGELELRIRDPQGWAQQALARSGTAIDDQDTTEATG